MKRVRYLAGAVGLAPVALGMLPPATARASGPGPAPAKTGPVTVSAGRGKLVSTVPIGTPPHAIPNNGCTGATEYWTGNPKFTDTSAHFWWTKHGGTTCIGTVVLSVSYRATICKSGFVSIASGTGFGGLRVTTGKFCGKKGFTYTWDFGVHRSFGNPVQVCASSTYNTSPVANSTCNTAP